MSRKLIILAFVLTLAACGSSVGSSYLGKWVRVDNAAETLEITQNGDNFLLSEVSQNPFTKQPRNIKTPAILKDELLQVQSIFGAMNITYIKATDTLSMPGGSGSIEYQRVK